jgi:hypothetical protein
MEINSFNNVEEKQRNAEKVGSILQHPTHWKYFLVYVDSPIIYYYYI